jgi:hypothetical protein
MQKRKLLFIGLSLFAILALLGMGVTSVMAATSVSTAYQTDVEEESDLAGDENKELSHYCQDLEIHHPVAWAIVNRYFETADETTLKAEYEKVMNWFCGVEDTKSVGMGQIMLAFQTAERTEDTDGEPDTYDMYLTMRTEMGWGKIWQTLGLIGRPEDAEPPEEEAAPDESESSVDEVSIKNTGKPETTGKPADIGKPDGTSKPDHTGKPEKINKPDKPDKPAKPEKPGKPGKP